MKCISDHDRPIWDSMSVAEWVRRMRNDTAWATDIKLTELRALQNLVVGDLKMAGALVELHARLLPGDWLSLAHGFEAWTKGCLDPDETARSLTAVAAPELAIGAYQMAAYYKQDAAAPAFSGHDTAHALRRAADWMDSVKSTPFSAPEEWTVGPSQLICALAAAHGDYEILDCLREQERAGFRPRWER
jgi:hypothetical protein